MSVADGELHQEIIIVRRGGHDEDEAHHGGVWKIAFADFMTAMMCFFLVMWLINAANEQTKAAVASYFNPIKLIDRNTARKGIDDPAKTPGDPDTAPQKESHETPRPTDVQDAKTGPSQEKNSIDESKTRKHSDKNLFANPYAVLAEIAGETGTLQNTSTKGDGGAQESGPATGASGGQTYRDPFAPNFWSQQVDMTKDAAATARSGSGDNTADQTARAENSSPLAADEMIAAARAEIEADKKAAKAAKIEAASASETKATASASKTDLSKTGQKASKPATPAMTLPGKADAMAGSGAASARTDAALSNPQSETVAKPGAKTNEIAADIRKELAGSFGGDNKVFKGLTVTETDKGVLISVSDQFNFGMFEIGSAVPTRETVLAMEKISKILSAHKGNIRIDGHTDARPFKSDTYDNWRLSSARAQSAYYMLLRAGLDEKRVMEVAGFADRRLKVKDDPYAAANRRIDILLETK